MTDQVKPISDEAARVREDVANHREIFYDAAAVWARLDAAERAITIPCANCGASRGIFPTDI